MKSMTGFGRAELSTRLGRLTVEIASLNNRFLDFTFRAPRLLYPLELRVRELVGESLVRGKVNVSIAFEESESALDAFRINSAAAKAYYRQLTALRRELNIAEEVSLQDVLLLPEVSSLERLEFNYEEYWPMLETGINRAVKQVISMRRKEGQTMARDLRDILKAMTGQVKEIQSKTATSVESYRKKLTDRINEIMDTPLRDTLRLEEEIALFAEKSDVTEEYTRLRSHIDQFKATLKLSQPVGKRLNFILQEMNREVNTIGSKCAEFSISSTVILLKEEIERLREMVQNAE
jgi:uncharacterized protein (TIGR00255 family)